MPGYDEDRDYEFNARFDRWDGWGDPDYHADLAEYEAYRDAELRDELNDFEEIDENGVSLDCPVYSDDDLPF